MRLIIIGASGHGKVVADIAFLNGYQDIVFLDDDTTIQHCLKYPVIGTIDKATEYEDAEFIVAIGNSIIREKVQKKLQEAKRPLATLIHPNAVVAADVSLEEGTVIMAGAVINSGSSIGMGCIINTGATVDHDNHLDDFVHISVGAHLAGTVSIGKGSWIGAGAVVNNNVKICKDCMIGAGAVVLKDINKAGTYIGIPAKEMTKHETKI